MKKVLLLGGTGAMGVYLSERLSHRYEVYVTSRKCRSQCDDESVAVHFINGDAKDDDFLKRVIESVRPDGIVDFMTYTTEQFRGRVDWLLNGCEHYVFLSTYRVFAGQVPLTERSPRLLDVCTDSEYLATDEYAMTKARQEDILRKSGMKNWTIIRPAITFSKARFQFGCLEAWEVCYRSLAGYPVIMPREMMDRQATLTWANDVALMIERLLFNEKAYSEDFNVATSEHMTRREIGNIYAKEIGMTVKECSLNEYIKVIGSRYQVMYDRMFNRIVDNSKVLATTGLSQQDLTPIPLALARELQAFKKAPRYPTFIVSRLARIDKIVGTRIPLKGLATWQKEEYLKIRYPFFNNRAINIIYRAIRKVVRIARKGV